MKSRMLKDKWKILSMRLVDLFLRIFPFRVLIYMESRIQIALGKGWSPGLRTELQNVFKVLQSLDLHSLNVIDGGANVGDWTAELLTMAPNARVVCFEPSTRSFDFLFAKFASFKNVQTIQVGLGHKNEHATLYLNGQGSSQSSLYYRENFRQANDVIEEEVEINQLDWQISKLNFHPNFLKCDLEGNELNALIGAKNNLQNISLVQFEFGGTHLDSGTTFRDFWNHFYAYNFELFRMTPKGLLPITEYHEDCEVSKFTTYFAINSKLHKDWWREYSA